MKTFKIFSTAMLWLLFATTTKAQVSVNVNLGVPVWAPAAPPTVGFYYLPEIQTYYDVHASNFIYLDRGRWIRSPRLPRHYRHYDLHHGRTVFLSDYHGHHPYYHYKQHRNRYYAKAYHGGHHVRPAARIQGKGHYKPDRRYGYDHGRGHGNGHGRGNGHSHQKHKHHRN